MDVTTLHDHLTMILPAMKDSKFCACSVDVCDCGERFPEYEWVWDMTCADPDTVVLSRENRETLFHPRSSSGTSAIRGAMPFKKGHVYYWEIKMLSAISGTNVIVGVGTKNTRLNTGLEYCSLIGEDKESWGYSYRGTVLHNGQEWDYGLKYDQGAIIGVKLDMWNGNLEFYFNRKPLGVAFKNLDKFGDLYPLVSSTAAKTSIRMVNCSSMQADLMHHCLRSLREHFHLTRQQMEHIPSLKKFIEKCWWSFSDDDVLYPNNLRKKDYHWFLDEHSHVSRENRLKWNMRPNNRLFFRRDDEYRFWQ